MIEDENEPDVVDKDSPHCTDCDILIDALRDFEQQCREAEDRRHQDLALLVSKNQNELLREERTYLERLKKLEHRRNCALEVLLKHQSLEHI
jgi:hypothetical protein